MIRIDLRTQIIPPTVRCWRLFPGSGYKFLKEFQEQGIGFLDIPGFEMPAVPLSQANDLPDRLRASEIILDKILKQGRDQVYTATDAELGDFRVGKRRRRNQQAIVNFYERASMGDVVIMPEPLFQGRVHIGVIEDHPNDTIRTLAPRSYGENAIPARRIGWARSTDENKLSGDLSRSLRHQHPFSILQQSQFLELFSLAFDSYVFQGHYSSTIYNTKDDYTDRETALIGLVSTIAANLTESIEEDGNLDVNSVVAFIKAASMEYHCSQASDIHSPGFNRFTASKPTAIVIAAMIAILSALSACDSKNDMEARLPEITVLNSSAQPHDDCTASVSAAADRLLKTMDSDTLWEMCQAMKDAEARAGLESSARVGR